MHRTHEYEPFVSQLHPDPVSIVSTYQSAKAKGFSEADARRAATLETFNITPWSVDELLEQYRNNSDWDYILEKSMEAHTRGNNLFDGYSDPNNPSSRSYWMRQIKIQSECGSETNNSTPVP
jgi:hypothetical protein